MLVPVGQHLINADDVIFIGQFGPDKICVEFRNGQILNIQTDDPKKALTDCLVYIANRNA